MAWQFELVAGPYEGPTGGVVRDGDAVIFSTIDEGRLLALRSRQQAPSTEVRRYTNRVNGLARGPDGELYGAQEGGRRLIEFTPDGRVVPVDALLDGKYHNQPSDLVVDRQHRIWFTDPRHSGHPVRAGDLSRFSITARCCASSATTAAPGWRAASPIDTVSPRAVLLVARRDDALRRRRRAARRAGARAARLSDPRRRHASITRPCCTPSARDHRGPQRGIEGMCLDADGNIVAVGGWRRSGPGPLVYVVLAAGRRDREPSVSGRPAEQMLFRRTRP